MKKIIKLIIKGMIMSILLPLTVVGYLGVIFIEFLCDLLDKLDKGSR